MSLNSQFTSPMELLISFDTLFQQYEQLAQHPNPLISEKARSILHLGEQFPELRHGFADVTILKNREKEIAEILQDLFSSLLTHNEIKAASVPFHDTIFNLSSRFHDIISKSGSQFQLEIKNMAENERYIMACTIILNDCYNYNLNLKRPFHYEIPDKNGIMRYYKILYNANFTEIIKTDKAPNITQEDVDELLDNYDNIMLWKQKFPENSYIFKGFVISNIFDVTDDFAISEIKSNLIAEGKRQDKNFIKDLQSIFQSFLRIPDIRVGFSVFNKDEGIFERVYGEGMHSFLLNDNPMGNCADMLCKSSYKRLLKEKKHISVSNIEKAYKETQGKVPHIKVLNDQGFKSAIFAPIANKDGLMGILELVSHQPKALNSINANKLEDVMPYIVATVERSKSDQENLIEAVIQQECTSIHPSVHWRFKQAAQYFIKENIILKKNVPFGKIAFENVYPLFGQIDVKGSSEARNLATQKDLSDQLKQTKHFIEKANNLIKMPIFEQITFQINAYLKQLETYFKVDSEHVITQFLKNDVTPLLELISKKNLALKLEIDDYFSRINSDLSILYHHRKNYDRTIGLINKNMSTIMDNKQIEAQKMYPHFFERFKTDGVEHNMYIGESITREDSFSLIYLYNLRLWQIQVMCEMENEFYNNQDLYPLSLDVASMILVFNQPLSIRFRMDEKQFDVDGTYNARYEVVKKRVDKAFIKGTTERITAKGKLSIVFSQQDDETEYLKYIHFFQAKNILGSELEVLELEDLQGVTGLKAIRVSILYNNKMKEETSYFTYHDVIDIIGNQNFAS
ncbi:GAF domain-containing protein [Bizionia myxarmorum]|uniref:GAF domain-containing protein n=1 Tax=Bizionia myxarmorum TaxID=291186 RepID=A0A5D0REX6_9FLAO|nr:GAF domain-containing protein [Bizionia myxarmorum]TYB79104.1 GAF domain-containing protein [Bizionia myxarmorum]